MNPNDFVNAFRPEKVQQTETIKTESGMFEKGYFNPSESMLQLTQTFLLELKKRIKEKHNVDVVWRKQGGQTIIFIPLTNTMAEMYTLRNDGYVAEWQFHGHTQYRSYYNANNK